MDAIANNICPVARKDVHWAITFFLINAVNTVNLHDVAYIILLDPSD